MKQSNNTEIDLLIRRHAWRWSTAASTGSDSEGKAAGAATGTHLDADEISAYAEGALPPAARARYMAHLADCDACRKIVTDLALAISASAEAGSKRDTSPEASPSRSWRSLLAGLFAPPVLRYAVPAILLFGVIVVALVATRERRERQLVAQNEQQDTRTNATATNEGASAPTAEATPAGSVEPAPTPDISGTTPSGSPLDDQTQDKRTQSNVNALSDMPAQKGVPVPPVNTTAPTDSTGRDEDRNDGVLYGNTPKAPAPPAESPAAAPTVAGKADEGTRREEQVAQERKAPATENRSETAAGGRSKDAETTDSASVASKSAEKRSEPPPAARKSAQRSRSATPGATSNSINDNLGSSTEMRSVGGRKFRRQGNAWVDTAYNTSRATVSVSRGSDQYRALVADEPGIGSIAEQLGGEVIVVWKGKAYRIR